MNRTAVALFAVAALACSGCLDFDRQTMHILMPQGRDELHAVFIYEGLHINGSQQNHVARAKEELKDLVNGKALYLGNHMLRFHLTELSDDRMKPLQTLLAKHLSLQDGVLFLDDRASLNASQTIRIRELTAFVQGLNEFIAGEFAHSVAEQRLNPVGDFYDAETLALIERAIQDKHVWLSCEPGRISFTMPASDAVIARFKRQISGADDVDRLRSLADTMLPDGLAEFRKALTEAAANRETIAGLPWSFQHGRKRFTVSLGVGEGEPLHLVCKSGTRMQAWDGELVNFARNSQLPVRKDLTVQGQIEKLQREVKDR
ncbi:MAG: hypothetical protein JNM56_05125 [Planctomycetia bacterium]|nr:hypothetical protein [Planctomycetia bacterium]